MYKKDLHDPDNHEGVITHTHLESDLIPTRVAPWAQTKPGVHQDPVKRTVPPQ